MEKTSRAYSLKDTSKDELIDFLITENSRLNTRLNFVSAKSYRKSRHIRNALKGIENRKDQLAETEVKLVQEMVSRIETETELERCQLRVAELASEKRYLEHELNGNDKQRDDIVNSAYEALDILHKENARLNQTINESKVLSWDDWALLVATFGCGVSLTIFGAMVWMVI